MNVRIRVLISAVILGLVVFCSVLGVGIISEVRSLSKSEPYDMQWSIQQIETELARLGLTLAEERLPQTPNSDRIRLRTDIAISRIKLVVDGRAFDLIDENPEAVSIVENLVHFATEAARLIDSTAQFDEAAVLALTELTKDARVNSRRLAIVNIAASAVATDQERADFAHKLGLVGAVALSVVTGLAALLFVLDRMLVKSDQRDAELRVSAERLKSIVAASTDAIVIVDENSRVMEFNRTAEQIFGWRRDEIINRTLGETIVPLRHRETHANGMRRFLKTGRAHVIDAGRVQLSALRKSGEEFPVEISVSTLQRREGQQFIAYIRDISEQKIAEHDLIKARDHAEQTDRAKSHFLAVMSHEMRTPLNGILGVLDLMRVTDLSRDQAQYLDVATASSQLLLERINEALDITRIETGSIEISKQRFNLQDILGHVNEVLSPLAHEKGLDLRLDIEPHLSKDYFGDSGRIVQIVTNVVGNGIKFTKTGSVVISVSGIHGLTNSVISIAIQDTGPGIKQEHLSKIFEDFVAFGVAQGRQARSDGLGLSISRKIARLMDGDLTVQSQLGQGSTFTLSLPLERALTPGSSPRIAAKPTGNPKRSILIAEDNAINRVVLRDMLNGFGHNVTEAENGYEAVRLAQQYSFDLIIMDISMPVLDGIAAVKKIRAGDGPNQHTHILGLTAHGEQEYKDRAISAGMDLLTSKPLRMADLHNAINGVIATRDPAKPDSCTVAEDVVLELLLALGPERMRSMVRSYFEEFDIIHTDIKNDTAFFREDPDRYGDQVHRLRGGAAMLGLSLLVKGIDGLDAAIATAEPNKIRLSLELLSKRRGDARSAICQVIRSAGIPQEPVRS